MLMLTLPCYKKIIKNDDDKKKKKKEEERREKRRILLFHTFAAYHQGPWPIHTNRVYGPALLLA
jgi:hypothetical protein